MPDSHQDHMIAWFEIPATDFERAVEFYNTILNVDILTYDLLGEMHGHIPDQGGYGGGVIVESKETKPGYGPILFLKVTDMHDVLKKVEKVGGKVILPKTLITIEKQGGTIISKNLIDNRMGYYGRFEDSEGNQMGLYSNS